MKAHFIVILIAITLIGVGTAVWLGVKEKRKPWPEPTPPPPPSPIYQPSKEHAPTADEIAQQAREHNQVLELEIERALLSGDAQQREAAFTFLLPELIQVEAKRVVDLLARQKPGEARDTLSTEVARQWTAQDLDAAIAWMRSLNDEERRASAITAAETIAPYDPEAARALIEKFGLDSVFQQAKAVRE